MTRILLSLGALLMLGMSPAAAQSDTKPDHVFTESPSDHATGAADAPHTLIVYASNMCPHCQQWFTKEWPIVKRDLVDTGQLRVVFRPLPSAPVQLSMIGFMMAECAPENDYFAVMENQFRRQDTILAKAKSGGLREEFDAVARVAGLDSKNSIDTCLGDEAHLAAIHQSAARAGAAGVSGIPSFFLDGERFTGDHKAADFAAAIDAD